MEQTPQPQTSITKLLLERLFRAPDVGTYLRDNADLMEMPAFHRFLCALCEELSLSRAAVIARSDIPRNYAYQLFNGIRKPSRDKVIQLAFGFGLDLKQTQELLKIAGQSPLVPQVKRDAAILYCVLHQLPLDEVQKLLENFMMHALGN